MRCVGDDLHVLITVATVTDQVLVRIQHPSVCSPKVELSVGNNTPLDQWAMVAHRDGFKHRFLCRFDSCPLNSAFKQLS